MDKDLSAILSDNGLSDERRSEVERHLRRPLLRAVLFKDFDNFDECQRSAKSFQKKKKRYEASIKRSTTIFRECLKKTIELGKHLDDYPKLESTTEIKLSNGEETFTEIIERVQLEAKVFAGISKYLSSLARTDIGKLRLSYLAKNTDEISCSEYHKYRPKAYITSQDLITFNELATRLSHWVSFGCKYLDESEFDFSKNELPIGRSSGGRLDHRWWYQMESEFDAVLHSEKVPPKTSASIIIDIAKSLGYPNKYLHKENTVYRRILKLRKTRSEK